MTFAPKSKLFNLRSSDKFLLIPTKKKTKKKANQLPGSLNWIGLVAWKARVAVFPKRAVEYLGTCCSNCFTQPLIFQSVSISFVSTFPLNFISILDIFYSIKPWQISLFQQLYGLKYVSAIQQRNKANSRFF